MRMTMTEKRKSVTQETKASRIEREARIWQLYVEGWLQVDIAKEVGVRQGTVSKTITRIYNRMMEDQSDLAFAEMRRQYDQLREVEKESMAAWIASKENANIVTQTTVATPKKEQPDEEGEAPKRFDQQDPQPVRTTRRVEVQTGNPAHLANAMRAMEGIRRMMGLNSPEQVEFSPKVEAGKSKSGRALPPDILAEAIGYLIEAGESMDDIIDGTYSVSEDEPGDG
jgi:transposase